MKESQGPDVFDSSIDQSPLLIVEDASSSSADAFCDVPPTQHTLSSPTQHTPSWHNPYSSTKIYFSDLSGYFTTKFLCYLAIINCFISGGSYTIVMALSLPLFKDLGIDASLSQMYMCMISLPWAIRPFIGVASDLFPIGGYNKRYSALIGVIIGVAGCVSLLWLVPDTLNNAKEAEWIVLCFAAVCYQAAALSSSGEGKYSELINLYPQSGSSIASFKSGWYFLGCILAQSFVGPLSDKGHFHISYWVVLFLSLIPLLPILLGWIPEKKRVKDDPGMVPLCGQLIMFDKGTFLNKRMAILLITLCGLSTPLLAFITTYASVSNSIYFAVVLIVLFCGATYFVFPKSYFWIFVSVVLTKLSNIKIGSVLGYYYTASATCLPDGPNFSYTYYISITGVLGSIMCLLTVVVYQSMFSNWKFRSVLLFTLILNALASTMDLVVIKRWNISIGIPDKIFFIFGATVFENITGTLYFIPYSAIYAKMSPPGMEASGYAYVQGLSAFCILVANIMGSEAIHLSGIKAIGEECNFDALSFLIIFTQIIIPIVIGVPATFLIPNVLQTERLIDWDREGWYSVSSERSDLLASGNEEPGEQDDRTAPLLDVLNGDPEQQNNI